MKILIIDDSNDLREIYVEIFKASGFEVEEATDGVEGLDKALKIRPDVILTGIIMPRMDGFSMKEMLSKNVATSNIPVFISSHRGREEDRIKSEKMGCQGFFVQGLDTPKEVVERIKTVASGEEYKLRLYENDLDAFKIVSKLGLKEKMQCPKCSETLIISLKPLNSSGENKFYASFICPKCQKNWKA